MAAERAGRNLSGGVTGIRRAGGDVHVAVAGGFAEVMVGFGGLAGNKRGATARHAEDPGVARGQFVACDAPGNSLFCGRIGGNLRRGPFFGDAAASAVAPHRAEKVLGLFVFLRIATGGAEFVFNKPFAEFFRQAVACGDAGGGSLRGAALAESGACAFDIGGRNRDVVAIRAGAEHPAAGAGTGNPGCAGLVGVSVGMASFDEGGAGVLGVPPVE